MPAMPYVNKFFEYYKDHRVVIYLRNRGLNKIDFEDYAHYVLQVGNFSEYIYGQFLDFEKLYTERLCSGKVIRLRNKNVKKLIKDKERIYTHTFIIDNMFKPLK